MTCRLLIAILVASTACDADPLPAPQLDATARTVLDADTPTTEQAASALDPAAAVFRWSRDCGTYDAPFPWNRNCPYLGRTDRSDAYNAWERRQIEIIDGLDPQTPWSRTLHTFAEYELWNERRPQR